MRKLILGATVALLLAGCGNDSTDINDFYVFIPDSSDLVVQINDADLFQNAAANNPLISNLTTSEIAENIKTISLNRENNSGLICFNTKSDSPSVVISDSTMVNLKKNTLKGEPFRKLLAGGSSTATFSMVLSPDLANQFTAGLFDTPTKIFNEFVLIDVYVNGKDLHWEMVGNRLNSEGVETIKGDKKATLLSSLVPESAIGFQNFLVLENSGQQSSIHVPENNEASKVFYDFMKGLEQWGIVDNGGSKLGLFKSINPAQTLSQIQSPEGASGQFRNVSVFELGDLAKDTFFATLCPGNSWKYYCVFDDVIAVGNSPEDLESVISAFQSEKSLSNIIKNNNNIDLLGSTWEAFSFKKNKVFVEFFNDIKLNLTANKSSALIAQLTSDASFYFLNGVIYESTAQKASSGLSERLSLKFEEELAKEPQLIYNHKSKGYDLAVQDNRNRLKFVSPKGALLWQKSLDGIILGQIEQVDLFKNGRQQMAFATSKTVYVLDINGKDVAPFPLKLKDPITQPLSVFDYDQTRDYRMSVVQGTDLFLIDGKAKRVEGFKYNSIKENINSQPTHFRISGKDYIVFRSGEEGLKIINRLGEDRVRVSAKIPFADRALTLYNDLFSSFTKQGELVQIDAKGNVVKLPLEVDSNRGFAADGKSLVTIKENVLKINQTKIELPFGNYGTPKIWRGLDNMYVSIIDQQSNQIFVFDRVGQKISGFPVFGSSEIDLQILGKNKFLLTTLGDRHSMILYEYR
jgi:hypothetical protein